MLSAAERAVVEDIEDSPSDQRYAKFIEAAAKLPIYKLLAGQAMVRRERAKLAAAQTVQMAVQGGANPAPQTTVAQDIYSQLHQLQPQERGVSSLPIRNDMYDEANYAGGGIVAFNGEDQSFVRMEPPSEATRKYQQWASDATLDPVREAVRNLASTRYMNDLYEQQRGRDPLSAEGVGALMRGVSGYPLAVASDVGRGIAGLTEAVGQPAISAGSAFLRGLTGGERATSTPSTTPAVPTRRPSAPSTPDEWTPTAAKLTGIAGVTPGARPGGIAAPGTAGPGIGGAARPTAVSDNVQRARDLEEQRQEELLAQAGTRPEALTPEQAQQRAKEQREKALKDAGMKSYKDRINEISSEAAQAKEDRNTDRWLAAAQGFFAMGAARSPWALKNMSEGLGVTTSQLREAEKDYRKAEQARKDKMALLEEAQRKETLGDVAAGRELHKEAVRRGEEFDLRMTKIRADLLKAAGERVTRAETSQQQAELRREIAASTAATRAAAGKTGIDIQMLRELEAAGDDLQKQAAIVKKYKTIIQTVQPQRFEKPEDQMMATLLKGGAGGTLTKGPDGQLMYVPGKQ